MYSLLRNLLFCLPAEASHTVAMHSMDWCNKLKLGKLLAVDRSLLNQPRRVMGIDFPNPIGLAAGLDKNADYVDALHTIGFGFIEVGTLTPRPQPGNPKPRLFRLADYQAIINRMGFNNAGIEHGIQAVRNRKSQGVVGINIGKNYDTPVERAIDDYLVCMRSCYRWADYITVNLSSPNTPGLRDLQFGESLRHLVDALKEEQSRLTEECGHRVPLAIKLAPDLEEAEIQQCCSILLSHEVEAIIATNTTLDRSKVKNHPHSQEQGGLSGAPLTARANEVLQLIKAETGSRVALIGAGGIMSAEDALQRFQSGADLAQLYTGFIYHGPSLLADILDALKSHESCQ